MLGGRGSTEGVTAIASNKIPHRYTYIVGLLVLAACGSSAGDDVAPGETPAGDAPPTRVTLPPEGVAFDYQLGGEYVPPSGVGIVSRDRTAPAAGVYDICYVNGFQAQENELQWWRDNHDDLLLRTSGGSLVIDEDWNEALLDIGTGAKRDALADVVGAWIDGCAAGGYEAVEIDNLDTYARSSGLLTQDDAVAMIALFSARAHAANLAIAQKNSAEIIDRRDAMGTDFVVNEECAHYDECSVFTDAYGAATLEIEYERDDFDRACAAPHANPIILRDRDLRPVGARGYVYERC